MAESVVARVVTHDYNNCETCRVHWLLWGNVFIDTSTGEHVDPRDMIRYEDGRWELVSS